MTITRDNSVFPSSFLLAGGGSATAVRRQLDRWVKSGRLLRLRRGVYAVALPYRAEAPHPFLVANHLRRPSYVSLQSALSHYGMIPEFVPVTTSVTTGRPEELDTPLGRFLFRHVKKSAFFGYTQTEISGGQPVFLALPEKALLDLLYLTPGSDSPAYLEELRFEPADRFDWYTLRMHAEQIRSRKLKRAVELISRLGGGKSYQGLKE
ncbi:MAG: type IV toxin-antitoxin system AbiEi family antitoxin domain-containing protein [Proteobacteria bacterium]|nr:type IV toxin-antitoxin system AbiEi family antitoxin domain-containing protein [Pseudomonadota bacterium]